MAGRRFHNLDPLGDGPVPSAVTEVAEGQPAHLVWRNDLGALTFRIGDRFLKWNPHGNGIDLERERVRLTWLSGRHPVPRVVTSGVDDTGQWLLTEGLSGESPLGESWQARRSKVVEAVATGLRALHALPTDDVPASWTDESWVGRTVESLGPRPQVDEPVVVHGDACLPNTLVSIDGRWVGHVDLGDLCVGDRWADLAIASMSLGWNFGEDDPDELFAAYGIAPDPDRITYYRTLWHQES